MIMQNRFKETSRESEAAVSAMLDRMRVRRIHDAPIAVSLLTLAAVVTFWIAFWVGTAGWNIMAAWKLVELITGR
jgi:uncharacterized protein YejL (UPF0352 family)